LVAVQRVPLSLDDAWGFFSDPRNLALITPASLAFRLRTPDLPREVYPGLIVEYTVTPVARVPVAWVAEITHVVPKELFVDEQRRGPYALWHHEHHFREVEGGVEVRDLVSYAVPFGPLGLGDVVNALLVRRRLEEIFAYRRAILEDRFGALEAQPRAAKGAAPD
jgi:ligand-binding SRPBCC domain-containing protein